MKITKELKLVMQANSFIGIVASAVLIKLGAHILIAYAGLLVNFVCLVHWVFIGESDVKEDKEDKEDNEDNPK